MNKTADRPPILRFMALFMGLLIVATGLAALRSAGESASDPAFATHDSAALDGGRGAADAQPSPNPSR